jgi:TonB family protein
MRPLLLSVMLLLSCGGSRPGDGAGGTGSAEPSSSVVPGEEPLETATLDDEEIVPLKPETTRDPSAAARRPCAWARAWGSPNEPKPLAAGIDGVDNPVRVADSPISLPVRKTSSGGNGGEMVVEIVVGPDGSVSEAAVVRSTDPPWPEAEAIVVEAVRQWRYEPPKRDGTPVAVCTTLVLRP